MGGLGLSNAEDTPVTKIALRPCSPRTHSSVGKEGRPGHESQVGQGCNGEAEARVRVGSGGWGIKKEKKEKEKLKQY